MDIRKPSPPKANEILTDVVRCRKRHRASGSFPELLLVGRVNWFGSDGSIETERHVPILLLTCRDHRVADNFQIPLAKG